MNNWTFPEKLALSYLKGVNSYNIKFWIEKYASMDSLLANISNDKVLSKFEQGALFGNLNFTNFVDSAKSEIELCERSGVRVIDYLSADYPPLLKNIDSAPVFIYVKGNLDFASSNNIAIVGTRRLTHYGKFVCERFAEEFVRNDLTIVSGLANGVDTIAHESALRAKGKTIAVIGSGINKISPSLAVKLARDITENGGAIISEYKINTVATPAYFPQRNRIISGVSNAVLVVESGEKGGSLITARFAFDQNRAVFAIPGNINSDRSKGTNALIQNDVAKIATSPEQVLNELGYGTLFQKNIQEKKKQFLSAQENLILDNLSGDPTHIDALAELTGISIVELTVKLLDMEFKDLIRQIPGKHYVLPV